jgi:hypothetical protein
MDRSLALSASSNELLGLLLPYAESCLQAVQDLIAPAASEPVKIPPNSLSS